MSECTCYPVPFEDCTTYGSAVEPGSAFEPNPDCPEHFPSGGIETESNDWCTRCEKYTEWDENEKCAEGCGKVWGYE